MMLYECSCCGFNMVDGFKLNATITTKSGHTLKAWPLYEICRNCFNQGDGGVTVEIFVEDDAKHLDGSAPQSESAQEDKPNGAKPNE